MIARIAYVLLLAAPLVAQAQPAPAQITLEEAVRRALSRNPTVGVAVAEIQRARALMREVRSFALPTIIGTAVATRLDSARRQGTTVVQPRDSLTGDIAFTVPLVAPQRWVNWSHAAEQVDVARLSAEDVRRQIAVSTARAYVTVLGQHRLVQANRLARDNAKDHLVYARARLEAGTGNRLDAVRSAQDLASNEAQLANALVNLSRAQEALSVLVGADGPLDAREDVELPAGPPEADAMHVAEEHRADLRAARGRIDAAEHVVRDSYADYLPFLSAVVTPFAATYSSSSTPSTGWQAQLVLTVPFFDGGFRYGAHEERSALADEARLSFESALRQARSEVRTAFEEVRRNDDALRASQQAARLAEDGLRNTTQAYRAGATNDLDVVDAERRYRDALTAAATAEDNARQARIDLLAATGRFP
ncbi:MAG: TolC family protein [Myxococcales bacterium]